MGCARLVVISAPSGAGKTTLIRRLRERLPDLGVSVSHTTRRPRPGEVDGRDYHFVDRATFDRMVREGAFAEWAEVHGNRYGTSFAALDEELSRGRDVILDIDVQGALQLAEKREDVVLIFVQPPSLDELRRRLETRRSDPPEVIEQRLRNAAGEMEQGRQYPHVVVNEDVEQTVEELESIITSRRRCRREDETETDRSGPAAPTGEDATGEDEPWRV